MRVFFIHVGNVVQQDPNLGEEIYLKRKELLSNEIRTFQKFDIINADGQMQSIIAKGIHVDYGHFSDRKSISALWKAGKKIRKMSRDVDVVHVLWGTTTALITVLFSKKPVVISFCGSDLLGNVNEFGDITFSGRISRLLSQISALGAKRIITKSEQMKRFLWRPSRRKCSAIPNGVDLSSFNEIEQTKAREKLGWKEDAKIAIFFNSGGAPVKNQPLAEACMRLVKDKYVNSEMKIVHGVPHNELKYYYNAADLMLMTSHHEGSNNSIKEALACNLPIVSVDVGDSAERLAKVENCFVSNSRKPSNLANYVEEIFKNGQRSNGRDYTYLVSMEHVADEIIETYKKASL